MNWDEHCAKRDEYAERCFGDYIAEPYEDDNGVWLDDDYFADMPSLTACISKGGLIHVQRY
jgi:hypothetical protein